MQQTAVYFNAQPEGVLGLLVLRVSTRLETFARWKPNEVPNLPQPQALGERPNLTVCGSWWCSSWRY